MHEVTADQEAQARERTWSLAVRLFSLFCGEHAEKIKQTLAEAYLEGRQDEKKSSMH